MQRRLWVRSLAASALWSEYFAQRVVWEAGIDGDVGRFGSNANVVADARATASPGPASPGRACSRSS